MWMTSVNSSKYEGVITDWIIVNNEQSTYFEENDGQGGEDECIAG